LRKLRKVHLSRLAITLPPALVGSLKTIPMVVTIGIAAFLKTSRHMRSTDETPIDFAVRICSIFNVFKTAIRVILIIGADKTKDRVTTGSARYLIASPRTANWP
jgi:hypothetical protein